MSVPITVAYGDGIGPEIMAATLEILRAARAKIVVESIEIGKKFYDQGWTSGIPESAWDSIKRTKTILKAPITTPQGAGYKSLNVTLRKRLGLYANVRPCISYSPWIAMGKPDIDLVVIRENEEDLYAGIEYRITPNTYECLKFITREGCERVCCYAFEHATRNSRKKITCFVKDNIMKITDGLFYEIFLEVAKQYPNIEHDRYIVDIGAARVATRPQDFDMIVTLNLYGDIISDIAADVSGSVGLAGSANIGDIYAMFEAIHGSAPDIAGKNIANPSGLIQAAIMMLAHIGQPEEASKIHNAWLRTIEQGIHTADIYQESISQKKVGTEEFAYAVIDNLGRLPEKLQTVKYDNAEHRNSKKLEFGSKESKKLIGADIYVEETGADIDSVAERLKAAAAGDELALHMVSSRGLTIWPEGLHAGTLTDSLRCRFIHKKIGEVIANQQIYQLLINLERNNLEVVKMEKLYSYDGKPGFSLGQGQ